MALILRNPFRCDAWLQYSYGGGGNVKQQWCDPCIFFVEGVGWLMLVVEIAGKHYDYGIHVVLLQKNGAVLVKRSRNSLCQPLALLL